MNTQVKKISVFILIVGLIVGMAFVVDLIYKNTTNNEDSIKSNSSVGVTSFCVKDDEVNLYIGGNEYVIETKTLPLNAPKTLTYSSTDENICTVDNNGLITPINAGSCYINVTCTDEIGNIITASERINIMHKVTAMDVTIETLEVNLFEVTVALDNDFIEENISVLPTSLPNDIQIIGNPIFNHKIYKIIYKIKLNNRLSANLNFKYINFGENYSNSIAKTKQIKQDATKLNNISELNINVINNNCIDDAYADEVYNYVNLPILNSFEIDNSVFTYSFKNNLAYIDDDFIYATAAGDDVMTVHQNGEKLCVINLSLIPCKANSINTSKTNYNVGIGELFCIDACPDLCYAYGNIEFIFNEQAISYNNEMFSAKHYVVNEPITIKFGLLEKVIYVSTLNEIILKAIDAESNPITDNLIITSSSYEQIYFVVCSSNDNVVTSSLNIYIECNTCNVVLKSGYIELKNIEQGEHIINFFYTQDYSENVYIGCITIQKN